MIDKRVHQRYQVINEVGKPTQFNMLKNGLPGVLIDLSAGGMALSSYSSFKQGEKLKFVINIPGLATERLEGKVEWASQEGDMWRVGISFTKIDQADKEHINKMATDYNECKDKLSKNEKNVCTEQCSYAPLCGNPAKII